MQRNEEHRVYRHDHAKETHGQPIHWILAHQRGRERDERLTHEKDRIQPDHSVSGVPRECEEMVMIQPEFTNDDEADHPAQKLREKIDKLMTKLVNTAAVVQNWNSQLEHEQRYDNREDAVAECFNSIEPQVALGKAV